MAEQRREEGLKRLKELTPLMGVSYSTLKLLAARHKLGLHTKGAVLLSPTEVSRLRRIIKERREEPRLRRSRAQLVRVETLKRLGVKTGTRVFLTLVKRPLTPEKLEERASLVRAEGLPFERYHWLLMHSPREIVKHAIAARESAALEEHLRVANRELGARPIDANALRGARRAVEAGRELTRAEENALILAAKRGHPAVTNLFWKAYRPRAERMARNLYRRLPFERRMDFAEEGLARALERYHRLEIPFFAYAKHFVRGRILTNAPHELPRKGTVSLALGDEPERSEVTEEQASFRKGAAGLSKPEEALDRKLFWEEVERALPREQFAVLKPLYGVGMPPLAKDDIPKVLGITRVEMERRLASAYERLRTREAFKRLGTVA